MRNDPGHIPAQPAKYLSHAPYAAPENLFALFRNACSFIPFDSMGSVRLGTPNMKISHAAGTCRPIESRRRIKEFQLFSYCSANELHDLRGREFRNVLLTWDA
jgi:hypothetical protein